MTRRDNFRAANSRYDLIRISCGIGFDCSGIVDIRPISRVIDEVLSALIGRRDAARAQSATSAINRIGDAQDSR